MTAETSPAVAAVPSNAPAGSYRELLTVAVPLMLSAATQSIMHVIDRMFLTWHSPYEIAAALPAGILYWSCLSLPFGVASYVNTFVAQYEGAGRRDRVASAIWQGAYFSIAGGLLMMLAIPFSTYLFAVIGHDPEVAEAEAIYFRWLLLGTVPAILHAALSAFYSGRGKTYVVLGVNASCVAVNAVLDYVLIFGWGPFPELGIAGAAMTDAFGELLATLILVYLLSRPAINQLYPFRKEWRFDRVLMTDLLKFGGPSGLQMFIDVAGFTAFVMIVGWIGPTALAANNIAFNLNTMAFIPVIGIGIAVSTLVGQRIGEQKPDLAAVSTWKAFSLAACHMLVFGVIYTVFPHWLIAPYEPPQSTPEFTEVRETAIVLLRFVAIYSFFDAMAIVFGSAVRGAGDTRFAMFLSLGSAWLILVSPTYLAWRFWGPNIYVSWTFCAFYVVFLGFAFFARFLQGTWKTMSVIHERIEHPAPPTVTAETMAAEPAGAQI